MIVPCTKFWAERSKRSRGDAGSPGAKENAAVDAKSARFAMVGLDFDCRFLFGVGVKCEEDDGMSLPSISKMMR